MSLKIVKVVMLSSIGLLMMIKSLKKNKKQVLVILSNQKVTFNKKYLF